jgi:hypothetical protein
MGMMINFIFVYTNLVDTIVKFFYESLGMMNINIETLHTTWLNIFTQVNQSHLIISSNYNSNVSDLPITLLNT